MTKSKYFSLQVQTADPKHCSLLSRNETLPAHQWFSYKMCYINLRFTYLLTYFRNTVLFIIKNLQSSHEHTCWCTNIVKKDNKDAGQTVTPLHVHNLYKNKTHANILVW